MVLFWRICTSLYSIRSFIRCFWGQFAHWLMEHVDQSCHCSWETEVRNVWRGSLSSARPCQQTCNEADPAESPWNWSWLVLWSSGPIVSGSMCCEQHSLWRNFQSFQGWTAGQVAELLLLHFYSTKSQWLHIKQCALGSPWQLQAAPPPFNDRCVAVSGRCAYACQNEQRPMTNCTEAQEANEKIDISVLCTAQFINAYGKVGVLAVYIYIYRNIYTDWRLADFEVMNGLDITCMT